MIAIKTLFLFSVLLFILIGLADLTNHFGVAEKIANLNFALLIVILLLKFNSMIREKNEK